MARIRRRRTFIKLRILGAGGFKADVVVNFGTHGSLEFTRGKSLVLSENC